MIATLRAVRAFSTTNVVLPTLTTTVVSAFTGAFPGAITEIKASSGGALTSDGNAAISAWGVCWSTSINHTLANSFSQDLVDNNNYSFTSTIIGLAPNTTYYVRAYATNSSGTAYGNQVSFTTGSLYIGMGHQGGIIAYILQPGDNGYDANVTHGLIAAPSDQSTGAEWGCNSIGISGADGTAIGTGAQNTLDIINGCGVTSIAARICGDLVLGGYSDWYLPSKDELIQLNINQDAIGGFANNSYWSSTEGDDTYSWALYLFFYAGTGQSLPKHYNKGVRAFRAF